MSLGLFGAFVKADDTELDASVGLGYRYPGLWTFAYVSWQAFQLLDIRLQLE